MAAVIIVDATGEWMRDQFADGEDAPVDVAVLGPVGVVRADELLQPSSGITRALLGTLALAGRPGVAAETLAEVVWGAHVSGASESKLPVAVHRLRKWLRSAAGETVAVMRTTNGYALRLARGEVDVARFRRLSVQASSTDRTDRLATLDAALLLWRGRPLYDVPPGRVDEFAVARLERELVTATVEYARMTLAAGVPERAVGRLDHLVERHPLDERLLSVWIEVLACCGRQAEALTAYDEARARLGQDLGIDPGPELRAVHLRVLRQGDAEAIREPSRAAMRRTG